MRKKKVSILCPCLESYGVVERQIQYMNRLELPSWFEFILIDDGSDPPIEPVHIPHFSFRIVRTRDFRPWTQACATNFGAEYSEAEYLWTFAIDHFISQESIDFLQHYSGDKLIFPREYAVLDRYGEVITFQDNPKKLIEYGLRDFEIEREALTGSGAGMFVIKRRLWDMLGGYSSDYCNSETSKYGGDDVDINKRYGELHRMGLAARHQVGPRVFVFPNPAGDVKGLFHSLRVKGVRVV